MRQCLAYPRYASSECGVWSGLILSCLHQRKLALDLEPPYVPPGSAGSPFTYLDQGEGLFKTIPCALEAHHRTKQRLAAGGKVKKHPTPPGTPVPPSKRRTASQPTASKIGPLLLENVGSASSQPVVKSLLYVATCANTDLPHQASSTRASTSREQRQLRSKDTAVVAGVGRRRT